MSNENHHDHIAGVIIAGGGSRRFGGGDKACALLGGEALAAVTMRRAAAQLGAVSLNTNDMTSGADIDVIPDSIGPDCGPLAGVLAGLEWACEKSDTYTHIITLAVDTPFFPDDLVSQLAARLGEGSCDIVCAASNGRRHHLIALWPISMAGELREAMTGEGLRAVKEWLARWRVAAVEFLATPYDPFFNINTRADLETAEEIRELYFK